MEIPVFGFLFSVFCFLPFFPVFGCKLKRDLDLASRKEKA
jgi:hypothetical protein